MMKCKFYSEEIGKCLFDGPPDDCPFEDNENNCACFKLKEQKIEIDLKEIKQDTITQFVNLVNKKLEYYDKHNIKLSAFHLSSMMKEALHELGYED